MLLETIILCQQKWWQAEKINMASKMAAISDTPICMQNNMNLVFNYKVIYKWVYVYAFTLKYFQFACNAILFLIINGQGFFKVKLTKNGEKRGMLLHIFPYIPIIMVTDNVT